ncbi:hypothetical protein [Anoxybacillus flavithermus]|nr:hypothetical protein [Anoxybacillus flavithermus]MBE2914554.1 hypothetical protein [Anoxybacillus flavithermus]MBE2916914.1 hypothetical protein [Anoxybacillus flavithermus]MBE2925335.1 hypothetical protein [Anoxybacillus flavithermus]MBE2927928.1 hypothetical protein [Anoxybacillus flavithermus]MBE2930508.1 hypothetical protein [Anoxybacillus flavithermus]
MNSIWMIFIADHATQEKALNKLESLPKNHNYQLFEIPIDDFFGVITNNREICSGFSKGS